MHTLFVSGKAEWDITDAYLWYESCRPGLGKEFQLCLEKGLNQIQHNPLIFQQRYREVRIHFIKRFPYGIHYLVEEEAIRVLGVFHTARDPQNWEERL
jgi:plasmid stabilization system protein ParE